MSKRKITDINLYELLGIVSTASEQEIKKAYRKQALKCHPDKNPDNPKAAEEFLELSDALAILCDEKAREAYDKTWKAKERAKERLKTLNAERRKMQEDLERREREANVISEEKKFQKEMERLRKETSRILAEEQEKVRQQLKRKYPFPSETASETSATSSTSASSSSTKTDSEKYQDFLDFEAKILAQLKQAADAQKRANLENSQNTTDP